MKLNMSRKDKKAALKALSGLSVNLSAGWFALVFIAPNFWPVHSIREVFLLTQDILLGIFCLWLSFTFEKMIL